MVLGRARKPNLAGPNVLEECNRENQGYVVSCNGTFAGGLAPADHPRRDPYEPQPALKV